MRCASKPYHNVDSSSALSQHQLTAQDYHASLGLKDRQVTDMPADQTLGHLQGQHISCVNFSAGALHASITAVAEKRPTSTPLSEIVNTRRASSLIKVSV